MIKLKVKGSKIDDLCGAPISLKTNQEKFPRKVGTFTLRTNYHKTCRFRLNEHLVFSVHSQVEGKKLESGQYNSELNIKRGTKLDVRHAVSFASQLKCEAVQPRRRIGI